MSSEKVPICKTYKQNFKSKIQSYISECETLQEYQERAMEDNMKFLVYTNTYICSLCKEYWNDFWSNYI